MERNSWHFFASSSLVCSSEDPNYRVLCVTELFERMANETQGITEDSSRQKGAMHVPFGISFSFFSFIYTIGGVAGSTRESMSAMFLSLKLILRNRKSIHSSLQSKRDRFDVRRRLLATSICWSEAEDRRHGIADGRRLGWASFRHKIQNIFCFWVFLASTVNSPYHSYWLLLWTMAQRKTKVPTVFVVCCWLYW